MPSVWRGSLSVALVCALLIGREGPAGMRAQAPPTRDTASGALQRGLSLMETRGQCTAALEHFETAARSTEASIATRALLLRGDCLERLGRGGEARGSYQRLADRHPTHPLAREARARLKAAASRSYAAAPSLTLRRLDVAEPVPAGSLSNDGRYLAYNDGVPLRQNLLTGQTERLTLGGADDVTRVGWKLQLSHDGRHVAYTWFDDRGRGELRIAPAVGGTAETLVPAGPLQEIRPVAWSADGATILVVTTDADFRLALRAVSVRQRRIEHLVDLGVVEPFHISLSPDGRRVLFDHAPASGPRDIVLLELASRRVKTLVTHAANDVMPVFMPGGGAFLFASDRLGPLSLWRQSLTSSDQREPTLVRRDIGRIWAMGMTGAGVFVHGLQTGLIDVHTARLSEDGQVVEEARPLSATFAGLNQAPDWSPDGNFLVYASTRGAVSGGVGARALVIRDRTTGQERFLYPEMLFFNGPRWSYDGTRILVKGRSASSNQWGEFVVDARTAVVTPALVASEIGGETELGPHQWVPGRNAILLARHGKGIVEVDLATGGETLIVPLAPGVDLTAARGCAFARDGRTLAWSVRERSEGRPPEAVLRVREPDGTIRELLRAVAPDWLMLMDWAPDGRSVYVVRQTASRPGAAPTRSELWRVPIDGRPPVATGLTAPSLRGVSVHPDGRTVAYVTGLPTWEIWAMEGIR